MVEAPTGSAQGRSGGVQLSTEDHLTLSMKDVESRLGAGMSDSFVAGAFDASHLAGMAGFVREKGLKTRHKGRIWGVYVTPEKRGQAVGRKLLQMVLERGSALDGIEMVLISVAATQQQPLVSIALSVLKCLDANRGRFSSAGSISMSNTWCCALNIFPANKPKQNSATNRKAP